MKTVKALILAIAMSVTTAVFAEENPNPFDKGVSKIISTEVFKLLENPYFQVNEDMQAKVTIAINKNNEIVVLFVDCKDKELETYIKSRLNYSKISKALPNRTYEVPVKLVRK